VKSETIKYETLSETTTLDPSKAVALLVEQWNRRPGFFPECVYQVHERPLNLSLFTRYSSTARFDCNKFILLKK
jgi:hypothetical protein